MRREKKETSAKGILILRNVSIARQIEAGRHRRLLPSARKEGEFRSILFEIF